MKSRAMLAGAVLAGFILGFACVHPVAIAMQMFGVTPCTAKTPCIEGDNSGKGAGVTGKSSLGIGVDGTSTSGAYTASGVHGASTKSSGVFGSTTSTVGYQAGVVGGEVTALTTNYGVLGESEFGTAVGAIATTANGVSATTGSSHPSVAAISLDAEHGANILNATGQNNVAVTIDGAGNISTPGTVSMEGACASGCSATTHARSYGTTAAMPTIEDSGEAHLTAGFTSVRLDPAFANAIDARQGYLVMLTPEGDTHGLYVAQRSPNGFVVRETMSGRSDIAFAYRIVAHPYGVHQPRLPLVTPVRPRMALAHFLPVH
jgi:hypothetical protein